MPGLRRLASRASTALFLGADRVGIHVTPSHYYSSVPDRRWLRRNEDLWRRPATMIGIDWDLDSQLSWLEGVVGAHLPEVRLDDIYARSEAVGGFRYGPIEALILHCWIRTQAPRRIVEIGSGSSTLITSRAIEMNVAEGLMATDVTAIDPFMHDAVAGLPHVSVRRIGGLEIRPEDLDLGAGDLLFIDSTHAVKAGSEIPHLYLELLPRLPAGVFVHIHDIFLPYLFAPNLYESQFDWQETTLVAAFLCGNPRMAPRCALSALHYDRTEELRALIPEYDPAPIDRGLFTGAGHYPASLWLEIVE